jgi:hypothetical protein
MSVPPTDITPFFKIKKNQGKKHIKAVILFAYSSLDTDF